MLIIILCKLKERKYVSFKKPEWTIQMQEFVHSGFKRIGKADGKYPSDSFSQSSRSFTAVAA